MTIVFRKSIPAESWRDAILQMEGRSLKTDTDASPGSMLYRRLIKTTLADDLTGFLRYRKIHRSLSNIVFDPQLVEAMMAPLDGQPINNGYHQLSHVPEWTFVEISEVLVPKDTSGTYPKDFVSANDLSGHFTKEKILRCDWTDVRFFFQKAVELTHQRDPSCPYAISGDCVRDALTFTAEKYAKRFYVEMIQHIPQFIGSGKENELTWKHFKATTNIPLGHLMSRGVVCEVDGSPSPLLLHYMKYRTGDK